MKSRGSVRASVGIILLSLSLLVISSCNNQTKTLVSGEMTAVLSRQRLHIEAYGDSYRTDKGVRVSDILLTDMNMDGSPDILVLCEKRGSYGDHLPFFVAENDNDLSQHIFIYTANEKRGVYPLWMSSAIPQNISGWKLSEDSAGKKPFLTLLSPDGSSTSWVWDYFGLKEAQADR